MSATVTSFGTTQIFSSAESAYSFLFKRARTWWLLIALFLMADGGGLFTRQGLHPSAGNLGPAGGSVDESSTSLLISTAVMWGICALLIAAWIRPTFEMMMKQKAVLSFAVLAFASTLWSQAPNLTLRKATILFLYLLFAWFFVTYYSPPDQMRLLLSLGVVMALGSVLWVVFLPQYGIHPTGEWKGLFGQKNALGSAMFYLFSGLPFLDKSPRGRFPTQLTLATLPVGLILLSQSRTSLVMWIVLVFVRLVGPWVAHARREAIPFIVWCLVIGMAIIPLGLVVVLPLLGRDLTFTGRTHYWGMLLPLALKKVWLGYGYQGFFVDSFGEPGPVIFGTGTGKIFSADNGYLDVFLQFGVVGLGLLLVLVLVSLVDFLKLLRQSSVPLEVFWYVGLLIATFVGSVTDNLLWKPIRIIPFILAMACAGLGLIRRGSLDSYGRRIGPVGQQD